jgi:hypothetical protein
VRGERDVRRGEGCEEGRGVCEEGRDVRRGEG